MIRHILFIKTRPETSDASRRAAVAGILNLWQLVPGILATSAGRNVSPEGLAKGYDLAIVIDFVDAQARDAYLVHPAHVEAGKALVAVIDGGLDGLAVIDYEG